MKTVFVFCMCLIAGSAMAQEEGTEVLTLKAVKQGEEPQEVMDGIKQDFPTAIVDNLAFLPAKLYGENWSVNLEDNLKGAEPYRYQVNLKQGGETFKAVYNKEGKILYSKILILQAQLPKEVLATVTAKYPGWTVVSDTEKITAKEGVIKEIFHLEIKLEKVSRSLFLAGSGKLIKDVRVHRI